MTNIVKKSGILPWGLDDIQKAPSSHGVYVLRTATDLSSIVYIGSSENLQQKLREHFQSAEVPQVAFFDWYETESIQKAIELEREWVNRYAPKYNVRVN